MSYLSFIQDDYLLECIDELYSTYVKCQKEMTVEKFYENKVDPIKFNFDMEFNRTGTEEYFSLEIIRQNDKTISNAIGYFHQNLIGGIHGFTNLGVGEGCDIKKDDNTIFAEIKNKHNTMNSSSMESTFQKLEKFAQQYPNAICYLVEIIAKTSQDILWAGSFNHTYYSHPRVRRISADRFYALATGNKNAFFELCQVLPKATKDFLAKKTQGTHTSESNSTLFKMLKMKSDKNQTDVITQIMKDNFNTYYGFKPKGLFDL